MKPTKRWKSAKYEFNINRTVKLRYEKSEFYFKAEKNHV